MESFSINGVVQAEYLYNAMGQQVARRLTQARQTIHSVHDLAGNRLAEYDYDPQTGTATLLQEYIWLDGAPVAVVDGATGAIAFIRTDHIARPVFATDDVGVKVWEASYLPFGGVQTAIGSNPDLRFPGQWFQSESGLHQNWMREYDPTTGRYIQADPLGLVAGVSLYGYAIQNPSSYVDSDGNYPLFFAVAAGAAANMAFGYAMDHAFGDSCYTWQEAGFDAALGALFGPLAHATKARNAARAATVGMTSYSASCWSFGAGKSASKWAIQMRNRGWTPPQISEAISSGKSFAARNNLRPANGATRYVHPQTGKSVVRDNITKEIIHVGGDGFKYN